MSKTIPQTSVVIEDETPQIPGSIRNNSDSGAILSLPFFFFIIFLLFGGYISDTLGLKILLWLRNVFDGALISQ